MEKTVNELQEIVTTFHTRIGALPEAEFSRKALPDKWSKKEVLGHLIDSAQNNLRRFICSQYESNAPKIIYEQEFWVKANNYQHTSSSNVILLWKLINQQICTVLLSMPAANHERKSDTGKDTAQLHTIAWLADDYVKHLKHHMNQIIPGSFNITYP